MEGLLLVDKPAGPTSHEVVARARRRLGVRRVGHTGTLDPMATGLLILVVGRATRLARFVPASPKRYTGTIRLGISTETDDVWGTVKARHPGPPPDHDAVREAASALSGRIVQRPPDVSALSVSGTRAYRLARRGIPVRLSPREVEVSRFDLSPMAEGIWRFDAEVSSGTYIRSLARDLGISLGCGGALAELRRTEIGPFRVDQAVDLEADDADTPEGVLKGVVPLDSIPLDCPPVVLLPDQVDRFARGIPVPCPGDGDVESPGGHRAVRSPAGTVMGIATLREGRLHPLVVLAQREESSGLPPRNGL